MPTSRVTYGKSGGGAPKDGTASKQRSVVNVVGEENYLPTTLAPLLNLPKGLKVGTIISIDYFTANCSLYANLVIKLKAKRKQKSGH